MSQDDREPPVTAPPVGPLPGAEPLPAAVAARLGAALEAFGPGHLPRTHHRDGAGRPRFTNRLALETSPYLLQHAHNPVNWFPWGDEAFAEARRLGRPVFLSIGYSTCHWCHVMEAESFEDEEIATFLNLHYVAVKVDREERPDVDAVYMAAVQRLTGSGGWPMSLWLDADRAPFFGGTYFPPRDGARGTRPGFLTILGELAATFHREPERVAKAAQAVVQVVRQDMQGQGEEAGAAGVPGRDVIAAMVDFLARAFDEVNGGLRRAPKFPSNIPVRLLLRHTRRTGDTAALRMATVTLSKMAGGGMYDQLGGGFHRYSTDAVWLVPHFEKMLYDNALLAAAYAEAHQVTGRPELGRVARETCDYVLGEMTDSGGGFYAATDADSPDEAGHMEEGLFFVWREEEIRRVLGEDPTTELFLRHYDVRPDGNWEGLNILNVPTPDEATWALLADARAKLYAARARRPPPLRDEKILAAWNGLMISGLAVAGRLLDEPRYVAAAARAAAFVLVSLRDTGGALLRSFKDGRSRQLGFLDDHAFVAAALLDLYEATGDARWLEESLRLARATEALFAAPAGGWFMTGAAHEALIARERPAYDGAEPSGTSVAMMNAARLAVYTDDAAWRRIAERAFRAHAAVLTERPFAMTEALLALDFFLDQPREIVIVWPDGAAAAAAPLRAALRGAFLPGAVLASGTEAEVARAGQLAPFARDKVAIDGKPTAYVCRQGRCELPVTDPEKLAAQLL